MPVCTAMNRCPAAGIYQRVRVWPAFRFRRVLKLGGTFLCVVPAAEHLWELKQTPCDWPIQMRRGPCLTRV